MRDTVRAGEASTRRATDAASETARNVADTGAEAARASTRTMAEAASRGADTLRETTRDVAGAAHEAAGRTVEGMNRVFGLSTDAREEVAHQVKQNMDVFVQCNSVLMEGLQSIWQEWLGYTQEALRRQLEGLNAIARSRSVQDVYSAQSELAKDSAELLLNRSVKISELSAQVANDAVRRINARTQQGARQTRRA
ncbi:MAG TPA: phasin family protein [Azospirillum sp.]|nr:phasin family protein [Azospirillum sp.]